MKKKLISWRWFINNATKPSQKKFNSLKTSCEHVFEIFQPEFDKLVCCKCKETYPLLSSKGDKCPEEGY